MRFFTYRFLFTGELLYFFVQRLYFLLSVRDTLLLLFYLILNDLHISLSFFAVLQSRQIFPSHCDSLTMLELSLDPLKLYVLRSLLFQFCQPRAYLFRQNLQEKVNFITRNKEFQWLEGKIYFYTFLGQLLETYTHFYEYLWKIMN